MSSRLPFVRLVSFGAAALAPPISDISSILHCARRFSLRGLRPVCGHLCPPFPFSPYNLFINYILHSFPTIHPCQPPPYHPYTNPIPSLCQLYGDKGVPPMFLRGTVEVRSVLPRRFAYTPSTQYNSDTYVIPIQQGNSLWQESTATPRAANSATRYTTPGTDGNAKGRCQHL